MGQTRHWLWVLGVPGGQQNDFTPTDIEYYRRPGGVRAVRQWSPEGWRNIPVPA
jgi:hypothetical protein